MKLLRYGLANVIKGLMAVCLITAFIGIPYLVISTTWSYVVELWHSHPVWCVLLLLPILGLAVLVMKWALQTTGHVMMGIGSVVDKLEADRQ